jgi:hypothetical protein
MPEINDDAKFDVSPKCLRFITQVDGDLLEMRGLELPADQAATIAYLTNQSQSLEIEMRVKK